MLTRSDLKRLLKTDKPLADGVTLRQAMVDSVESSCCRPRKFRRWLKHAGWTDAEVVAHLEAAGLPGH